MNTNNIKNNKPRRLSPSTSSVNKEINYLKIRIVWVQICTNSWTRKIVFSRCQLTLRHQTEALLRNSMNRTFCPTRSKYKPSYRHFLDVSMNELSCSWFCGVNADFSRPKLLLCRCWTEETFFPFLDICINRLQIDFTTKFLFEISPCLKSWIS